MRADPVLVIALVAIMLSVVTIACDIRFTTEPVLFCVVDGDTIGVSGDTTGIRCAPIDPEKVP